MSQGRGGNGGHGGQNIKARSINGAINLSYTVGSGGSTGSSYGSGANGNAGGQTSFDGALAGGGGGGGGTTYGNGADGGDGNSYSFGPFFSSHYGTGGAGARPGPYRYGGGLDSHGSGKVDGVNYVGHSNRMNELLNVSGGQRPGTVGAIFILELG